MAFSLRKKARELAEYVHGFLFDPAENHKPIIFDIPPIAIGVITVVNSDLGYFARFGFQAHECIIYGITEGYPILSPQARCFLEKCKVVAPSKYSAEKLIESGVKVDYVVHFAVPKEPADIEEARRIRRMYTEKMGYKRIILWVGANMHRKGLDLFCELAEYHRNYSFVAYTGPGELNLESITEQKNCFVVDKVFRGNIGDYYLASDLLLVTSRAEGFGLPPVEITHFRKPVVLPAHPVLVEVMDGLGYFYDVKGPRTVNFYNIMYMEYYEPRIAEAPDRIEEALRKGVDEQEVGKLLARYRVENYEWFKRYTERYKLW